MISTIRRSALALLLGSMVFGPACNCNKAAITSNSGKIEVDPAAVVFTPLPPGKTSTITLQVSNGGALPLHLQSAPAAIGANGSGAIANVTLGSVITSDCQGMMRDQAALLTFAPGECAVVTVVYAPTDQAAPDGYIDFLSDDPSTPELKVPVSLGPPAALKVCTLNDDGSVNACDAADGTPPTLDFGVTPKNVAVTKKLRLTNIGTVGISGLSTDPLAGADASDFAGPATAAPTSLAVGVSTDLTFSFTPTLSGTHTATLSIESSDSTREPIVVPFTGIGAGPAICPSPSPVDFGNAGVGVTTTKTLTLTSCGTTPVNISDIKFDIFSSPDFGSAQPLPGAQMLAVGATLSFDLTLTPVAVGTERGTLDINSDGDPSQYVLLTGTAVPTPTCRMSAQSPLDFGQVAFGMTRERDASVTNAGSLDCHLTMASITAGSTYFSIANAPQTTITLRPGDVYTVQATYAVPQGDTDTQDTGTLTWVSDDPVHPSVNVALTGTPVAAPLCQLSVTPALHGIAGISGRTLVFGNVVVGHTKVLPVTFTNVGSAACNISGWKFIDALSIADPNGPCGATNCQGYTFVSPNPSSPLQPGQSTDLDVQYAPASTAQLAFLPSLYVQIQTSDTNIASGQECTSGLPPNSNVGCYQVGLSGQGDISNLQVLPSDLNFGLTTLGCSTQSTAVTLYNTGTTAPINISSITLSPMVSPEPFMISYMPTPFALAAGAETTINVTYRPTTTSVESAQILIASDASNTTSTDPYVTVALTGQGTTDKHQTDTFTQSALPQVDLLWVIDDSSSFQDYQAALSQQAPRFIANAQNADGTWKADFHIGVIGNEADHDDMADSYSAFPNAPVDIGGLFGNPAGPGPYIIDSNTPNAGTAFANNIKIGTCCSDARESDAEALWDALTPPNNMTAAPAGTLGFLRDSARLVMVVVTDEIDQSHNNTAFYIDFFKQIKGQYNAGLVSFNAITGDNPNGCSANGVTADANPFDIAIINGVGGNFWSLCSADWGQIADDLSLGAFAGRVQFPLSRVADPATIVVTMNGMPQTNPGDYRYDQPSNSVVFVTAPPANAVIVVDYDALCF